MARQSNELLEALKAELQFIEQGGYRNTSQHSWRPAFIFQDSPICLNHDATKAMCPCSECSLWSFVPEEFRDAKVPCRYIPLNGQGDTVDSLYRTGSFEELEAAVKAWLQTMISCLEREINEARKAREENASPPLLPPLGKSTTPLV